jgi:preprotein translocase subunit YajC
MFGIALLLAQGQEAPRGASPGVDTIVFLVAPLLLFFFLIVMPMRRDARMRREMMATLKKGDRVVANGFLIGTVVQIINPDRPQADGEVVLKGEDNAKWRVLRGSITRILKSDDSRDAKEGP